MNAKSIHHRIRRIAASLTGLVFILAGAFKLLDPVGAGLVVEEYLKFFHLPFLMFAAEPVAVALALAEALLGAALVSGVFRKVAAVAASVMVAFFTLLTFFLALFNPPMDCGCFGEVVHLSNLQTFLKNLILLALAAVAFIPFRGFGKAKKRKYWSFGIAALGVAGLTAYSLIFLPLVDYTDFPPGCELFSADEDTAAEDVEDYISTFVYEKNGQEGSFTLDRLPDSTWTYVRTETILRNGPVLKESRPLLSFTDADGNYQDYKALDGNVLVVSVYDPLRLTSLDWQSIGLLFENAPSAGFKPLLLVASTPRDFSEILKLSGPGSDGRGKEISADEGAAAAPLLSSGGAESQSGLTGPARLEVPASAVHYADRRTLLALNRSNGGATWFDDGQLIRKFRCRSLPGSQEELEAMNAKDPVEAMLDVSIKGRLTFQGTLLYIFAILLII